jgi:hypothetical protein
MHFRLASLALSAFLTTGLALNIGCTEGGTEPSVSVAAASNLICPIMRHEVTEDGGRVDYEGQTIGFCCPGCINKWNALSAEEKAAKLAANEGDGAHSDHHDHDHDDGHEAAVDNSDSVEAGHQPAKPEDTKSE